MALELNDELHQAGEKVPVRDWSLVHALGWLITSELVRRHPQHLKVYLTGAEYRYDVLAVSRFLQDRVPEKSTAVVWMNRLPMGHFTTGSWFDDSSSTDRFNWLDALLAPNRMDYVIKQIEREAGLISPSRTPATTERSVSARVIAGFLARTIFVKTKWAALNGLFDSGMGAEVNKSLFESVPGMISEMPQPTDHLYSDDMFRYWFLCRSTFSADSGEPTNLGPAVVGFDFRRGLCWNGSSEQPIVLMDRYNALDRSIDALISDVCPPAY